METGLRDELVTAQLQLELDAFERERLRLEDLDPGEGRLRLARHLAQAARSLVEQIDSPEGLAVEVRRVNDTLRRLHDDPHDAQALAVVTPAQRLTGVFPEQVGLSPPQLPQHPVIPLGEAKLLANAPGQPSLGQLVRQEAASARRVDLLCAFIGPTGVHTLLDALEAVVTRRGPGSVRVITSTWLGATKRRALDMLCEIGADVYVVYDGTRLRLHAKAWRFERPGGLSTAYVGSSNLSKGALEHGLEWNVRLSERTNAPVVERIHQTFESYLANELFEHYDPARDGERLESALAAAGRRGNERRLTLVGDETITSIRPRPYPYQARILDELNAARERHGRHRNLVVAATGTGKTVIAAFDYARLAAKKGGPPPSLLFVAHREEILRQSLAVFRSVLGRPQFGEILSGGRPAPDRNHVFVTIQSLREQRLRQITPDAYDIVVIDEFHHAAAPSYERVIAHLEPQELLGLTATPERADGKDVTSWFGGHITSELRLWEAVEHGLLSPFHYFGIDDRTNLTAVRWTRGRYDANELSNVFSGNDARVRTLLTAMQRYVPNLGSMRALGFCVSIDHARFMTERFTAKGIPSAMVDGTMSVDGRQEILVRLADPTDELRCVFSVDVLGEGVDVPDVDTLLLLRPTESATVFLQQLGRGLRLAEGKDALTVLDLVGIPHERFRFDRVLGSILDPAGGTVRNQAELGFPFLPSGCEIYFEQEAHQRVLQNLRASVGSGRWKRLVSQLQEMSDDTTLEYFLEESEREVEHIYSGRRRSWGGLRREAGYEQPGLPQLDEPRELLYRMLHIDDEERTGWYRDILATATPPVWSGLPQGQQRLLDMLLVGMWGTPRSRPPRDEALNWVWSDSALRTELRQLFAHLGGRSKQVTTPLSPDSANPLRLHARYTKEEALIGYGKGAFDHAPSTMPGVYWIDDERSDCFFVTLRKDDKTFSPETRYHDYAIRPDRFHWESQNRTTDMSPVAMRYRNHSRNNTDVVLFVRETSKTPAGAGKPFTCLGRCVYRSDEGSAPVQFVWDLEAPMPPALFEVARLVAG